MVDSFSFEYVVVIYVIFNELICVSFIIGSYEVKIDNNGVSFDSGSSGLVYFLVYDLLCYDCNINIFICV